MRRPWGRYTDSLKRVKRVKLGGRHTGHLRRGGRAQRGPLQLPPFPSLSALFRTARSGQGRAGFARRSEPLTARTVLEDGDEGKGGGVAGVSPAGFGAAPQFYARERICSPTRKPEIPAKPTFIADSCAQPQRGVGRQNSSLLLMLLQRKIRTKPVRESGIPGAGLDFPMQTGERHSLPKRLRRVVEESLASLAEPPHGFILALACDVSQG